MDILRLIADRLFALRQDAYFETGWIGSVFAHPSSHTFWEGDDWPSFDREYPFSGLVQKIDYTLFQRVALGQRGKMATVWGDPNSGDTRRWFAAALALGAQITAGFDLTVMDGPSLSALRALLAHYRPFEGQTVTSSGRRPDVFATVRDGMTYVGVLNRSSRARSFADQVAGLGLQLGGVPALDTESGSWLAASQIGPTEIPAKSFRLYLVPYRPQVVWSNASWSYDVSEGQRFVATLRGPTRLSGFAEVWAPGAREVLLDGRQLRRGPKPEAGTYTLDERTGALRLHFSLDQPHRLEVRW